MEVKKEDLSAILDIHPPLLWVEKLTVSVENATFKGLSIFDTDFWAFRLHAPSKLNALPREEGTAAGVLPGMFGLEALAQCSAASLALSMNVGTLPIICRSRATFLKPIVPGEISVEGSMKVGKTGWTTVEVKGLQQRTVKLRAVLDYPVGSLIEK